jgi:hypothetical protein
VAAGVAIAALGSAVALLAFLQPQQMRAPAGVVYAAALAFVFAGWAVVARARGHPLLKAWLPVPLLLCMVTPALWLGFGPGYRQCGIAAVVGLRGSQRPRSDSSPPPARAGGFPVLLAIRQAVRSSRDPAA